ncbi:MAG TPA: bifunctional phosphoribosylaminoimidazolecarboxamide formyltransferase/IMP cyclohydrolase [Phycisphaerales bacterium]|nr:bifunctional phosphoribosylaminoimidazolecarboxamide formyltransferase/IMP cyclohydrolase [Phycisphaerales bacterium]
MPGLVPVRTALLSVHDKAGLVPFAAALHERGVGLISTGGTAAALTAAGLPVTTVETLTGFPEGLDGRVKTLHPAVHAGLLAVRDNPEHAAFLARHGLRPIDVVCVNLYPFVRTATDPSATFDEVIEQIDVGGPAMLRAAAKNFRYVAVVPDPRDYEATLAELAANSGATTAAFRRRQAQRTFGLTSRYDEHVRRYLEHGAGAPEPFPARLALDLPRVESLRYGENPHQRAALYRDPGFSGPSVVGAAQLHGKQLSYNNINDASAALRLVVALARLGRVGEASRASACIVKHLTPCGCAAAPTLAAALDAAIAGDPLAAYGGVLACGMRLDRRAAERVTGPDRFFEVVVAPGYEADALEVLRARWIGVRVLEVGALDNPAPGLPELRGVPGGVLVQEADTLTPSPETWTHAAGPPPEPDQLRAAAFLDVAVGACLSNAVVIGTVSTGADGPGARLLGVGAGQVDRLSSCRIAVAKAGAGACGAVAVSDAFFPFDDGPRVLIEAGVRTIVHPGGSKRDADTISLCRARGVTCLVTGVRRFRH